MVQDDRDLPNPFQDSNADYADDEQVDATEADESSEQESSSKINKSSYIRLKEPWHTLATSAISLVSLDHCLLCP
jgi:hypothetical protein